VIPAAGALPKGTIEVRVRELTQLFDSMDPSPFRERDLDPEAEEYILGSAKDLPSDTPIVLVVHVDRPSTEMDESRVLREAVHVHFARRSQSKHRELRQLLRRGRTSLAIGLVFLAASLLGGELIAQRLGEHPLGAILRESMVIGGWVAMWRPMEIFLYDWWPLLQERRIFDRLSDATIRVVSVHGNDSQ
jgi:hypothetical protein